MMFRKRWTTDEKRREQDICLWYAEQGVRIERLD
jgi:hypothetical protein